MRRGMVAIFVFSLSSSVAHASCDALRRDIQSFDQEFGVVISNYNAFSQRMSTSADRSKHFNEMISHGTNVVQTLTKGLSLIQSALAERCAGKGEAEMIRTQKILSNRKVQFEEEIRLLRANEKIIRGDVSNSTTGGQTSLEYITKTIRDQVTEVRAQLPRFVDQETMLLDLRLNGKTLTYDQKLQINTSILPSDIQKKVPSMLREKSLKTCADRFVIGAMQYGYIFAYNFVDISNTKIAAFSISLDDCKSYTAN